MDGRIGQAQDLLRKNGCSALVATPGADMAYLARNFAHASERPQMLIVPAEGKPVLVISAFEARSLPSLDGVEIVTYGETRNPYDLASESTNEAWWKNVLISDVTRSDVLLRLQGRYSGSHFLPASPVLRDLRMIKDAGEVDCLREAARRADTAFTNLLATPMTGAGELELETRIRRLMEDEGLRDTWAIVASGPNGASPHHHSGARALQAGDLVVFDFGGTWIGYGADCTRTIAVGDVGDEEKAAYEAVRGANAAGSAAVWPGVSAESVDQAARAVIETAGFGEAFIHRTGHGIGLETHEEPYIVAGNTLSLAPGMAFSVEPGVYLEGRFGIRIEDIVVVTTSGADILNSLPRELHTVS